MATPRKTNPSPTIAQLAKAEKEVRERGTPTNMSLEEFEAHQKRFTSELQPAGERRGHVTKAELYGRESRLIEEMILRGFPAMVWEQIQIATGMKTQFIVNHGTGQVEEVPVDPKTQVAAFKELRDTVFGKPETTKHVSEEIQKTETLRILIGPAADEYNAEQERLRLARVLEVADPERPLILPAPTPEELLALPKVFEDREIRKLALDSQLKGLDEYETRAAIHEQFGPRSERRARRKQAGSAGGAV